MPTRTHRRKAQTMTRSPKTSTVVAAAAATLALTSIVSPASAMPPDNQAMRIEAGIPLAGSDSTTLRFGAPAFTQARVPTPSSPDAPFAAGDQLFWVAELY